MSASQSLRATGADSTMVLLCAGRLKAELLGPAMGFDGRDGKDGAGAQRATGAGSDKLTSKEVMVEGAGFFCAMPLDMLSAICRFFSSVNLLLYERIDASLLKVKISIYQIFKCLTFL